MRQDILQVKKQGVKGMKTHVSVEGKAALIVSKGYNEPENIITVDTFEGLGRTYHKRDTAIIEIVFSNSQIWTGTFDELKNSLLQTVKTQG